MDTSEYIETKMNTPISSVEIHSSLPIWTIKTGTIGENSSYSILGIPKYSFQDDLLTRGYIATLALPSIKASALEKKNRKYVEYISEFSKDWDSKKTHFNSFTKDFVWNNFKIIIDQLLQLKPDQVSFSLTNDCSIFFKALVKEKNVYLELFFDEESDGCVEAIVNIYSEGKVVIAYGGNVERTFQKIQEVFVAKDKITASTSIPYAISSAYLTAAEF